MHKRAWIIAAWVAALAGARTSAAAVWEWKDGCPAYFPPEDVPSYTHDVKVHEGSAAFGTAPEADSLLAPSRIVLDGWASTLHPDAGAPSLRREAGLRLVAQGNLSSGPMFGLIYAGYAADRPTRDGNDYHLGDLTLFAGYRHTGYLLGPMFRTGFAVRIAGGGPLTGRTAAPFAGQRELVAINSPFRASSFGIEAPITGTAEYRIEMVGCRGPFLDLRLDLSRWRLDGRSTAVIDAPAELALGAYPAEGWGLYVAIGEDWRSAELEFRRLTRVSLGLEAQPNWTMRWRIGAHVSAITGANVGGFEVGLALSLVAPKGFLEGVFE
jgi:hypothetical protein